MGGGRPLRFYGRASYKCLIYIFHKSSIFTRMPNPNPCRFRNTSWAPIRQAKEELGSDRILNNPYYPNWIRLRVGLGSDSK